MEELPDSPHSNKDKKLLTNPKVKKYFYQKIKLSLITMSQPKKELVIKGWKILMSKKSNNISEPRKESLSSQKRILESIKIQRKKKNKNIL